MANLTEKELSALNDLLASEELEIKKFNMLSDATSDPTLKQKLGEIASRHQHHFNTLFQQLN